MNTKNVVTIIFVLLYMQLFSQKNGIVSGIISDSSSNETLIGAVVYDEYSKTAVATNNYGFFSLKTKLDSAKLKISFIGYTSKTFTYRPTKDSTINIQLRSNTELREVNVTAQGNSNTIKQNALGAYQLNVLEIKKQASLMGESDVMKSLQSVPGMQFGKEGTAGVYVRGGTPDQNVILIDDAPIYNANHLFGFASVFNTDAIKSVHFFKGAAPAEYNGRLSSVIDIHLKDGNLQKPSASGNIGLIASSLTFESPILKKRASLMFSARRSNIDLLSKPFLKNNLLNNYYFYDVYAKIKFILTPKCTVLLSSYMGKDVLLKDESNTYWQDEAYSISTNKNQLSWQNIATSFRLNYILSQTCFVNARLSLSDYRKLSFQSQAIENYDSNNALVNKELYSQSNGSGIRDYNAQLQIENNIRNHSLKAGIKFGANLFSPAVVSQQLHNKQNNIDSLVETNYQTQSVSLFVKDNFSIQQLFFADIGCNLSRYAVHLKEFYQFEPRVSVAFELQNVRLRTAYARNSQNAHLVTNNTIGLPTDLWIPASAKLQPQSSDQVSAGADFQIAKTDISLDVYYKKMYNIVEYREGEFLGFETAQWEDLVTSGNGKAAGVELLLQKSIGKAHIQVGYCLSKSTRQFDEISFGQEYPFRYDKRHSINCVAKYKINDRFSIILDWVFTSGEAITLSTQRNVSNFFFDSPHYNQIMFTEKVPNALQFIEQRPFHNIQIDYYEHRNNFRMPSYHRMDIACNYKIASHRCNQNISFGVYNVYNQQNVFYYYYQYKENIFQSTATLKQLTLFPFLPFVSYNIQF